MGQHAGRRHPAKQTRDVVIGSQSSHASTTVDMVVCHETARLASQQSATGYAQSAEQPSRLQSPLAVTRRMDQPKTVTFRAPGRSSSAVRQALNLHVVDTR